MRIALITSSVTDPAFPDALASFLDNLEATCKYLAVIIYSKRKEPKYIIKNNDSVLFNFTNSEGSLVYDFLLKHNRVHLPIRRFQREPLLRGTILSKAKPASIL